MKAICVLFCCLSLSAFSQIENSGYLFKKTSLFKKPSGVAIDLGSSLTQLQGYSTGSLSFGLSADLFKNGLVGFSFNMYQNKNPRFSAPVEVINPRFNLSTFTLDYEYIFLKSKPVSISVFNKTGVAYASYSDMYYKTYYSTGKTSGYKPRTVMDQYYFTDEAGLNANINLCKKLSLCAGSSYRYVSGPGTFGSAAGFNGFNANIKLRFKISDK